LRNNTIKNNRIVGIELFRIIAAFAVICIHTKPFIESQALVGNIWGIGINHISRFAVPFYFSVAGFLWGRKGNTQSTFDNLRYINRIFLIYITWCIIYIVPFDLNDISVNSFHILLGRNVYDFIVNPSKLFFFGTKVHLWYMPAFLMAFWLTYVLLRNNKKTILMYLGVIFYIIGLLGGSYSVSPLGIDLIYNTRNGPFMSLPFFIIGWWLSQNNRKWMNTRTAFAMILSGLFIQILEAYVLFAIYAKQPSSHDFLIGTLLFGGGVTILAIKMPDFVLPRIVERLAKCTVGVYAIQYIFIDLTMNYYQNYKSSIIWNILYPIIIFGLSSISVIIISRIRILRVIVT